MATHLREVRYYMSGDIRRFIHGIIQLGMGEIEPSSKARESIYASLMLYVRISDSYIGVAKHISCHRMM
jgi:hypothetical protein